MTAESPQERFLRAVHKTVFLVDRRADRLLHESMGGTFTQFLMLTAIVKCKGFTQQKIAEFLNLTPAAISRQIDTLAEAGFIERKVDPNSRRAHIVSLTEAGTEHFHTMHKLLLASFKDMIPASAEELDAASETMERFVAKLHPEFAVNHQS